MSTEIFFSTAEETRIFLCALLFGGFLSAVNDLIRMLRVIVPHHKAAVFLEDVIYMLFCALAFFVFSLELVRGSLRFFVLAALLIGFCVWRFTVGNLLLRLFKGVRRVIWGIADRLLIANAVKLAKPPLAACKSLSKKSIKNARAFVLKCTMLKKSKKSRKKPLKDGEV